MTLPTLRAELVRRFRLYMHNARINRHSAPMGADGQAGYWRYLADQYLQRIQAIDNRPDRCIVSGMDSRALLSYVRPLRAIHSIEANQARTGRPYRW